jgi:hypothetical protein
MKPVKVPIEDILDLHTFNPKEIPDLLSDFFVLFLLPKFLSM